MNKLQELKGNSAVLTMHARAIDILRQIGFIDFLRERATPQIIGLGDNVQVLATQAARSAGYFEALDDLLFFKEKYYTSNELLEGKVPLDYGGLKESVRQGFLTEEEANGLKLDFKQ